MGTGAGGGPRDATTPIVQPWRLRTLLIVILGLTLVFWSFLWLGPWGGVPLAVLAVLLGVGTTFVVVHDRASQRYSLLWMLAIAADHRMPTATMVEAFADLYRGGFQRRVARLARLLHQGAGVSHGLREIPGLASPESAMIVEIGEESGRPGEALRRAATLQSERSMLGRAFASQASSLGVVLLIGQAIVAYMLYYIVPRFEAIFRDFGISLPLLTDVVIRVAHVSTSYVLPALSIPILTVLVFLGLPRLQTGGTNSWLPFGVSRRRRTALILRTLAMTAESGRPLELGLHTLAIRHPVARIRRELAAVETEVRRGGDWRESLLRHDLIAASECEALKSAQTVGNLPWVMNDLADAAERRANVRGALLAQTLWPLSIVMVGIGVLVLAAAFFLPLVELIGRVSG